MPLKRIFVIGSLAAVASLATFLMMYYLASSKNSYQKSSNDVDLSSFIRIKSPETQRLKERRLPKEPPKPKAAPNTPKVAIKTDTNKAVKVAKMNLPNIRLPFSHSGAFAQGSGQQAKNTNSEMVPKIRIEPRYPRKAAMKRIEGWVVLQFTVDPSGNVKDVVVVDSKPRRIFDSEARRAVLKWKYSPKVVNGKPIAVSGVQTELTFNIGS